MVNRVCLGNRGNDSYGLWVSKPLHNVLTAEDVNLQLSSDRKTFQIMVVGLVTNGFTAVGQTRQIVVPDFGFKSMVMCLTDRYIVSSRYINNVTIEFRAVTTKSQPFGNGNIRYAILNVSDGS